jgi:peroxiredoxin Q/BCP
LCPLASYTKLQVSKRIIKTSTIKMLDMPLEIGDYAPEFEGKDQEGKVRWLSDFKGRYIVLYFYPKDGTPGCTKEACSFRDENEKFKEIGAEVIGISVDSLESHRKFAGKHGLNFPLISDLDKHISRRYGTLNFLGKSKRVTFIVDDKGVIRHIYPKVNARNHAEEVLTELGEIKGR